MIRVRCPKCKKKLFELETENEKLIINCHQCKLKLATMQITSSIETKEETPQEKLVREVDEKRKVNA